MIDVLGDTRTDEFIQSLLKKVGSSDRNLIEMIMVPFEQTPIGVYPHYRSPGYEFSITNDECMRQIMVGSLMALENLEEGLGSRLWRTSQNLAFVSRNHTTHTALDRVYLGPESEEETDCLGLHWAHCGLGLLKNGKGARNRLRVVRQQVVGIANNFLEGGESDVRMMSVAAGSGRGMVEAIASLNKNMAGRVNLLMVDITKQAGEDGGKLASQLGVGGLVEFKRANVLKTDKYLFGEKPFHFIEVVGLLDYLNNERAINLLRSLRSHLVNWGTLLFSNITTNDEGGNCGKGLLHKVIGWHPMIYRNPSDLSAIGEAAGFEKSKMGFIHEPCGVYNLVAATK